MGTIAGPSLNLSGKSWMVGSQQFKCFCRWGLMTLTTVGYDLNPETLLGKIIGGCCALSGVFILTLPIPIVVNSFATYYKNRLNKYYLHK